MGRNGAKMLWRSIRSGLGRYMAILAIVALGVGFFAGLKSSQPAMLSTAEDYLHETHFQDFQMMSTLGFTDGDVEYFAALDTVAAAEGAYFADAMGEMDGKQGAWHFMSLTESVSVPVLTAGRMPENAGECLGDENAFDPEDLGRVIVISEDNESDTLDLLARRSYVLVGLCRSPRYISSDRGATSLGSGSLDGFVVLTPEGFSSEAFHELLLWCDLPGAMYSETYVAAADRLERTFERLLNNRGALRYAQLRREAEDELNDARAELDQGWDDYNTGKAEAEQELKNAQAELWRGQARIDTGRQQIQDGRQALEDGMAAIPAAREEIEANRQQLEQSETELQGLRELLDTARELLDTREDEFRELLEQEENQRYLALEPYYEDVAMAQAQVYLLQRQLEEIDSGERDESERPDIEARLTQAQADLETAQQALSQAEADFDPENAETMDAQAVIDGLRQEIGDLEQQLADGEAQLTDGWAQLEVAQAEIDAAERDYPENVRQLDAAEAELNAAQAQVNSGWADYEQGKAEAEAEMADAEAELNDAEAELADAWAELDEKLTLDVYLLDRGTNAGYVTFESDTGIIDAIANAFPVFFVLIAALVCVTTMTRMVNEERTIIGTLKAMGYGAGAVMAKYLLYAGSSAFLGCVAGFFLGTTAIPLVVWTAYNIIYDYAQIDFYFSTWMYCACLGVSVLGALLVTWLACRRELAERPAELIRPKAPGKGKRILLEYVTPLWRRLSFLGKVTIRNAFRYRQRVVMMLLGISGCTALMVAGFGVQDSVADISRYQYEEISLYEMAVTLDTEEFTSDAAAARLWRADTDRYAMTWQDSVTLINGGAEKSTRAVAGEAESLKTVISIHDHAGPIAYPGPGEAVITQKLSDRLGLTPGDRAELRLADGTTVEVTVTGVCENFLNHYVYIAPETVGSPRNNTALLCAKEGTDPRTLAARLRSEEGVSYVSLTAQERDTIEQSMASLDLIVLMLVVCSGVLAFITLYNLTNINIMERSREIATVKVLGFYPRETAAYILRENLMLSFLGAGAGLLLGKVLHRFVMELIDVENMTCDVRILPRSYLLSFVITLLFAWITNAVMRRKLEKVDMAESLKSVE